MPTFFSRVIAVIFFLSITWFLIVTMMLGSSQKKNRQEHRSQSLQEIMTAVKVQTALQENYLPIEITTEWQQIGTASNGCAIQTVQCQITNDACVNLHPILRDIKKLSLPADIQGGGIKRTGFAIRYQEPDLVEITSCGSEDGELMLSEQFTDVVLGEVYVPATASGQSKDMRSAP